MPEDCGSTRFSTSSVAIAASTALPPRVRISAPARAASGFAATTMKRFAVTRRLGAIPVQGPGAPESGWARAASGASAAISAHLKVRTCALRRLSRSLARAQGFGPRCRLEKAALDLLGGDWRAEQEALVLVAVQLAQDLELLLRLDALRDHADSQAAAHGDDGADERRVPRGGGAVAPEGARGLEGRPPAMPAATP